MKLILLAGGRGVRFSEETEKIPKPLIKIGGIPIIEHILNYYSYFGINEFIICLGYKQELIKEYFLNYNLHNSDFTIDLTSGTIWKYKYKKKDWKITFVDTGENTLTGGRLLQVKNYVLSDNYFLLNYSDGLADIDIEKLIEYHKENNKTVTLTAVQKAGKFGTLQIKDNIVTSFKEKPVDDDYINGGFFCMSNRIFDFLKNEDLPDTLERIAIANQLCAYKYHGNWECMDTMNDKIRLEELWNSGKAFWRK
jgi:glucose-1-phosphate cytidylyltransferase